MQLWVATSKENERPRSLVYKLYESLKIPMGCFSCLRLQTLIAGLGQCRLLVEQTQNKHISNGHVIFLSKKPLGVLLV